MVLVASCGEMAFQKTAHRRMVCQTARQMAGGTVVVPSDSQCFPSVRQSWGGPSIPNRHLAHLSRPRRMPGDRVIQTCCSPYLSSHRITRVNHRTEFATTPYASAAYRSSWFKIYLIVSNMSRGIINVPKKCSHIGTRVA